ncbi:MAG: bifunctional 4-hydroxy-2-oxoglutarate aldolase/2-dehydro-3-deoxy-phosphogluconate aldolase [Lacibacter sp.]
MSGQKILPLFYHARQQVCSGVLQALYDAGIRMVEFTNRGPAALERFTEMVQQRNRYMPDLLLAVGTIRTEADVNNYRAAGADVLISPFWDDAVAAAAKELETPWIPGCMTPSEINRAAVAGIRLVKLFPGNVLGTGFVEAIRPLFPEMQYVVTGGVDATAESIGQWLQAGVLAAGLGSKLITAAVLEQQQFPALQNRVATLLTQVTHTGTAPKN